jgi:hypothetical protein
MSLTIDRFVTQCRVPRRLKVDGTLVARIAQEQFSHACSQQLAARWPREGVCRIRRLPVRLTVSLEDLNETRLPHLWAVAFVQAMSDALARSSGHGEVEVARAESRAAWLATVITSLLGGDAGQRWEYQEFRNFFELGTVEAVLAILGAEPAQIVPTLLVLQKRGVLDRLLAIFDEAALDKLFFAMGRASGVTETRLSLDDLEEIGHRVLSQGLPRGGAGLANRQRALRLFLAQAGGSGLAFASPRFILYALMVLEALLELPLSADPSRWASEWTGATSPEGSSRPLPSPVLDVLQDIRGMAEKILGQDSIGDLTGADSLRPLVQLLLDLKRLISPGEITPKAGKIRWVSSDCAGLLLLVGLLGRLRWPEFILRSALGAQYGPRAITYLLAGVGLALLGKFSEGLDRLDPGLALFAGWLDDPDLAGLRSFLAATPVTAQRELLAELAAKEAAAEANTENWAATLDRLAEKAVREFAQRVRGFRRASRAFVVKHFLAVPGRIRVEDAGLVVILPANPFQVALHLSGMDEKVEGVGWLGGRKVEFSCEGL